jgi:hypothetical protein
MERSQDAQGSHDTIASPYRYSCIILLLTRLPVAPVDSGRPVSQPKRLLERERFALAEV